MTMFEVNTTLDGMGDSPIQFWSLLYLLPKIYSIHLFIHFQPQTSSIVMYIIHKKKTLKNVPIKYENQL